MDEGSFVQSSWLPEDAPDDLFIRTITVGKINLSVAIQLLESEGFIAPLEPKTRWCFS